MPVRGDVHIPFGSRSGTIQAAIIATADIADDAVTGAKIAADAVDSEHLAAGGIDAEHLAADVVDGTKIADDAVDSEHIAAGAIDTEHIADDQVTEAKVADNALTGTVVANVADANVIGGIAVLHRIDIAGGAAGNTDVTLTHKTRVVDVWAVHTGGAGEASDTIQVFNGENALTDAMDWSGVDTALVRAAQIDDAAHEIEAAGTLRVTTTDDDSGDDVGAGVVYVLGIRVAT